MIRLEERTENREAEARQPELTTPIPGRPCGLHNAKIAPEHIAEAIQFRSYEMEAV